MKSSSNCVADFYPFLCAIKHTMIKTFTSCGLLFFTIAGIASPLPYPPLSAEPPPSFEIIEDLAKLPILSPSFRDRQTLKLRLANQLEVYLVSDLNATQSSAALVVKSGSWQDPKEYPGMAHFLEHLLFLGTKKYPGESAFETFISEEGGKTNAFTGIDYTAFVFSINNNAFPEALDRFSQFFIAPLFNPSGVTRELHAIDQEYAKNIQNDDIREYYVYKELSHSDHPNHSFSMGNKDSLKNISLEPLKKWYQEHYSANRMRLIVTSHLPLEEIKTLVIQHFKDIPDTNLPPFDLNVDLIPSEIKGHLITIEPLKEMQRLTLLWELPAKFGAMQDRKPELLVCQVLGYEGTGSLLNELKLEQLADGLQCNGAKMGPNNFEFAIEISLTDKGVKEVNKVILKCFQAIANLKMNPYPRYLFDELKLASILSYQYQEQQDTFETILKQAGWLAEESIQTFPEQTLTIQTFDSDAIKDFVNYLTPENAVYTLLAKASLTKVTPNKKEARLGAAYRVEPISQETLHTWKKASINPKIDYPLPNPFLPKSLKLISHKNSKQIKDGIPHPNLLIDDKEAQVYFAKDRNYLLPKISWFFEIKTPSIHASNPESIVLGDLYVKTIIHILNKVTYPATLAGLEFRIERTDNGLLIVIDGYSEKARSLFLKMIKTLKHPRLREQAFRLFKTSLQKQYQNAALESPLFQAYDALKSLIYLEYATEKAKALAIKKITFDHFEAFTDSLFTNTYTKATLYGNMTRQEALDLIKDLLTELNSLPYPKNEQLKEEVITLPDNQEPYYVETKIKTEGNVTLLCIEAAPYDFKMRAAQQVLMLAMRDPFFSNLRTKQQTGYTVISNAEEFELHLFNTFLVQSSTHEARDLLARFELFIESFLQDIKQSISKSRFDTIRLSLLKILKQPPKNISDMGALLHKLAFHYDGNFDWISERIKGMEALTYEEFLDFAVKMVGKPNKRRIGILLKGTIPLASALEYKKISNIQQLRKLSTYQPADFSLIQSN